MIQIVKPVKCPKCKEEMDTYRINNQTKHFIFTCSKGHTVEFSEKDYIEELKKLG